MDVCKCMDNNNGIDANISRNPPQQGRQALTWVDLHQQPHRRQQKAKAPATVQYITSNYENAKNTTTPATSRMYYVHMRELVTTWKPATARGCCQQKWCKQQQGRQKYQRTAEAMTATAWSSFHEFSEFSLLLQYAIWFLFKYSLHFAYRYSFASKKKKIFSLQWISALFCLVFKKYLL